MTDTDLTQATPLQEWFNTHKPAPDLLWKTGLAEQVMFVRDTIHPLLVPVYTLRKSHPVTVPSTHTSKSVLLPVFEIATPNFGVNMFADERIHGVPALRLRCRDNFYNWTVSVESPIHTTDRFQDLFDREAEINPVYAEGFQEDWVFPPFAQSRNTFTLQLGSKYDLYTFCWLLARAVPR